MRSERPVDLTVTLPAGSSPGGTDLRGYLEDDLRTRGEIVSADDCSLVVHAYEEGEVESIGDELVSKLSTLGLPDGVVVTWTSDTGEKVERPV
jgi:hypothetical protein